MEISDATQILLVDEWADEIETLSSTRLRVAAVDHLDGISPAMLKWWFANMDEESYMRFHPCDHRKFAWTRNKQPGTYLGATHLTYHQYGGGEAPIIRSEITFIEPTELLDAREISRPGVELALCAQVHLVDEQDQPDDFEMGRFMHVGIARPYGTELRSCWWLNVGPATDIDLVTNGRLRHVHEEFGYLQGFLRSIYPGA
jgi:hypothetical protein